MSSVKEFFAGVGLLFRGFATWRTAPGRMLLGLIPAVIVAAAFTVGLVFLAINIETLAALATPFADGWDRMWRDITRIAVALAFLIAAILIISLTFTTLTLIIGQPFYELVWRHAESRFGPVPDNAPGFWRSVGLGITSGLRMLVPTILVGVALFALGLVPLVGAILAAVFGAFVGGWFLARELTGLAFDARGVGYRERRAALRSRRPLVLGYGAATYLLFLVPLGAVVVMPAAVAASVLVTRRVLGETTTALARTR
ncbi:MAG: EI24 domain-containing protein [Actinobacteria bacterium]|nr:EI24 domain-containing protein [Actinomycetota bacterium]